MRSKPTDVVIARVPPEMKKEIQEQVARGSHLNLSDFLRDAIRTKLKEV